MDILCCHLWLILDTREVDPLLILSKSPVAQEAYLVVVLIFEPTVATCFFFYFVIFFIDQNQMVVWCS